MVYIYPPIDKNKFLKDMDEVLNVLVEVYSKKHCPIKPVQETWGNEGITEATNKCYHVFTNLKDYIKKNHLNSFPIELLDQYNRYLIKAFNEYELGKPLRTDWKHFSLGVDTVNSLIRWKKHYKDDMERYTVELNMGNKYKIKFNDVVRRFSEEFLMELRNYLAMRVVGSLAHQVVNYLS